MNHLLPTAGGFTATSSTSQAAAAVLRCATRVGHVARPAMIATSVDQALCEFIAGFRLRDLTAAARERLRLLLADMAAVCAAGRPAPAVGIAADHAADVHAGDDAALPAAGRRARGGGGG